MLAKLKLPKPNAAAMKDIGVKFRAWWNGAENVAITEEAKPDAETSLPTETPQQGAAVTEVAKSYLSSASVQISDEGSSIIASNIIWGEGRTSPTDKEFYTELLRPLELNKNSKLAIFSAETGLPISFAIEKYGCKPDAYFVSATVQKVAANFIESAKLSKFANLKSYDESPKSVQKNRADAILMLYCGGSRAKTESNIFTLARILKPKGIALWVDFVARNGDERLEESPWFSQRQFLTESEILPAIAAAGLEIVSNEDCGALLLNTYYRRQPKIIESFDKIQAELIKAGGLGAVNAALEQTMSWRARIDAMKSGRLTLKTLVLRQA